LYAADSLTVQPLDFIVLRGAAAVPVLHRDTTETFYKLRQIVCVPHHTNDVVTVKEAAELVKMIETAVDEV